MKKSNVVVGISLGLNIVLAGGLFSLNSRINSLNNQVESIEQSKIEIQKISSIQETDTCKDALEKDYTKLNMRIDKLESSNASNLIDRVINLESKVDVVKNMALSNEDIEIKEGTITNIIRDNHIELELKYIDGKKEKICLSGNCKAYFHTEIGPAEVEMEELIKKLEIDVSEKFEEQYTFLKSDEEILLIYQGTFK